MAPVAFGGSTGHKGLSPCRSPCHGQDWLLHGQATAPASLTSWTPPAGHPQLTAPCSYRTAASSPQSSEPHQELALHTTPRTSLELHKRKFANNEGRDRSPSITSTELKAQLKQAWSLHSTQALPMSPAQCPEQPPGQGLRQRRPRSCCPAQPSPAPAAQPGPARPPGPQAHTDPPSSSLKSFHCQFPGWNPNCLATMILCVPEILLSILLLTLGCARRGNATLGSIWGKRKGKSTGQLWLSFHIILILNHWIINPSFLRLAIQHTGSSRAALEMIGHSLGLSGEFGRGGEMGRQEENISPALLLHHLLGSNPRGCSGSSGPVSGCCLYHQNCMLRTIHLP